MPWTYTDPMTERHKFILACQEGLFSMTELCERFGISRKTGYKWRERYREGGVEALADRSRAPKRCPHRTPDQVRGLLVEARRSHPRWGPRKLLQYLEPRHPEVAFPAASTAGDILKAEGLVSGRRKHRPRPAHPGASPITAEGPDAVWTADFKGEFRLGSSAYCYPLTVQDAFSRYLLCCRGLPSSAGQGARATFEQLFRTRGLPQAIRTDNGLPFVSARSLGGLSRLGVWLVKLGVRQERIEPGCPQQNGRHERMHRTLKAETTRPPEADFPAQQKRFDAFRGEFNHVRPHQALGGATPASCYCGERTNSRERTKTMPASLPEPAYPGHAEVRKVASAGTIRFRSQAVFVSEVLEGEHVALEETDDGIWSLFFYDRLLGRLDERTFALHPGSPFGSAPSAHS